VLCGRQALDLARGAGETQPFAGSGWFSPILGSKCVLSPKLGPSPPCRRFRLASIQVSRAYADVGYDPREDERLEAFLFCPSAPSGSSAADPDPLARVGNVTVSWRR